MNTSEPDTYEDLSAWLQSVVESAGSLAQPMPELSEPHKTVQSVWTWLVQYELPHKPAIERAAHRLWLHKGEAFQDLPPVAASLLRLRIETADRWIEGFVTTKESPVLFPKGEFRELLEWLLVDWWDERGIQWGADELFLKSVVK